MRVPDDLRALRDRYGGAWFLYWLDGKLFALPRPGTSRGSRNGQVVELVCADHLRLLAARIADCLPAIFQAYTPYRQRPFTFLGQKEELIGTIRRRLRLPALLATFAIRPKYELEAKLVEPRDGEAFVGLFLRIGMRWEIKAPLDVLSRARVDLSGLYVVRRDPEPDQRRLLGRIDRLDGSDVVLAETLEDTDRVPLDTVWLEGSRASFVRCLRTILGAHYQDFENERAREEERFYTAEAVDQHLATMGTYLQKASPLQLTPDLSCAVGDRIAVANAPDYTSVYAASPVSYCFDPARTKQTSLPWQGLDKYGPFSRETFPKRSPRILVRAWLERGGVQAQHVHRQLVQNGAVDEVHLQADELWVRLRRGRVWQALALAVSSRLWLAGQIGVTRDQGLIDQLVQQTRACLRHGCVLVCVDGLASYASAFQAAFWERSQGLGTGLWRLALPNGFLLGQVIKRRRGRQLVSITRRAVVGTIEQIEARLQATRTGTQIHTAYIERLKSTFRCSWAQLARRSRSLADQEATLVAGMYLVGTVYNFCRAHASLRLDQPDQRHRWQGRTPAMAAGLTDHTWSVAELLWWRPPLPLNLPRFLPASPIGILREVKERNGWRPADTVRIVFHAFKPLRTTEIAEIVSECVQEVGQDQNIEFAFLTVAEDHSFAIMDRQQRGVPHLRGAIKGKLVPGRGTIVQIGRFTRLVSTDGPSLMRPWVR